MRAAVVKHRGAVGCMAQGNGCPPGIKLAHERGEAAHLDRREPLVPEVGIGKMGHQAPDPQLPVLPECFNESCGGLGRNPDAAHARIDLDVNLDRAAPLPGGADKGIGHVVRKDRRREVPFDDRLGLVRKEGPHQQDRRPDAGLAQFAPFFHERYAEHIGPQAQQMARNGNGAVAVGLGLHNGQDLPARRPARHFPEIVRKSAEVDPGLRGAARRRSGHGMGTAALRSIFSA